MVTNSNGTAIKFGNGLMLCYKTFASGELTADATYGVTQWNFPAAFTENPSAFVMTTRGQNNYNFYTGRINNLATSLVQITWVALPSGATATGQTLNICPHYAIGKWK